MLLDATINSEGELIHFALLAKSEPVTLDEAMHDERWRNAMKKELDSIEKNET